MLKIFVSLFHYFMSSANSDAGRHPLADGFLVGLLGLPLWLSAFSGSQAMAADRVQKPPVDESLILIFEMRNRWQDFQSSARLNQTEASGTERNRRRSATVKNKAVKPVSEACREGEPVKRKLAPSWSRAGRRDSSGAFSPAPHRPDTAVSRAYHFDRPAPVAWRDEPATDRNTTKRRTTAGRFKTVRKGDPAQMESSFVQRGVASWYGGRFHGRKTASGERYDQNGMTAAHKTLPFGSIVEVINHQNGKNVVVRINDRGPFYKGRVIDLSREAARILDMDGIAPVTVKVVAGLQGEIPTLN